MIPLRDNLGRRGATPAIWMLAAIWIGAYLASLRMDDAVLARAHETFGLQSAEWWRAFDVLRGQRAGGRADALFALLVPLVTYKVLHGGVIHVLSNAVFFVVFAGRLEARTGTARFLLFHETAGAAAGLAHLWWVGPGNDAAVGASGAVAASIVAYLALYVRSHVIVVVPIVVVPVFLQVPAIVMALAWALFQIRPIARLLEIGPATPIAWQAIVGGTVAGVALLPFVWQKRRGRRRRR